MRQVGSRQLPELSAQPSGARLAEGARFSETIANIAKLGFIPKGVYRFRTHEEANRHADECLARAMAERAAGRR